MMGRLSFLNWSRNQIGVNQDLSVGLRSNPVDTATCPSVVPELSCG